MTNQSLKDKTVSGTFWSAADAFLGQGITFLVGLVLARLLSPSEYGLIGICLIFTAVLGGIVDSGFSSALIRKKDVSNNDYNTMFIINMVASVVLYVLLFFSAPLIATFFARQELTSLVRAIGLILIFQALSITQMTILTKRIDFKTKTKASIIAAVISGALGIGSAFAGLGVWALVVQKLSQTLIYTLCLWVFNRWWPTIHFNKKSFHYMWGFGWKMMTSGLLNNIWSQLYQVVIGKCYTDYTLGQYTRSHEYANIFSANLTSIVQRVTYPVMSEIQDDKVCLVAAYRRIIKTTMLVTCICMISLGAVAEPLIYCLIGPKWHQAATFLPFICINLSLFPLHSINLNMLQVQGRSDIFLALEIVKKIIAIFPICMGIFVNIYWMLIASIITGIIAFFLNSYYTGKKLNYPSFRQLKDVAPSYGVAFVVALSVYFFKFLPLSYWIVLPMQIITGIIVCVLLCEATKLSEYYEIKDIIINFISSKLKRNK
ncbi:MAG: lipopolysaccharide biosynthesis protein [Bacteroidota bacterium]|nr:lipopolysaccharide biosynthesis protein [Bacteroidota bacterium]